MQYYKMQQLFYDDIKQSVFVKCVGSFTIKMQEFHSECNKSYKMRWFNYKGQFSEFNDMVFLSH